MKGDNLRSFKQKRAHVRASIDNAIGHLRESLGAPVSETLEQKLEDNNFYLGGLDGPTGRIPDGIIDQMRKLLAVMQESAQRPDLPEAAPVYHFAKLALPLRDATDGFKKPWWGRLGLSNYEGFAKEHWARIKALCRRIAFDFDNCEYSGLRPVADLVRELQNNISWWLDHPDSWIPHSANENEKQAAIDRIRRQIYEDIHTLANRRLIVDPSNGWGEAFELRGSGSSYDRADRMARIYEAAAPTVTSLMDMPVHQFMDEIYQIVRDAVEEAGGDVQGIPKRDSVFAP